MFTCCCQSVPHSLTLIIQLMIRPRDDDDDGGWLMMLLQPLKMLLNVFVLFLKKKIIVVVWMQLWTEHSFGCTFLQGSMKNCFRKTFSIKSWHRIDEYLIERHHHFQFIKINSDVKCKSLSPESVKHVFLLLLDDFPFQHLVIISDFFVHFFFSYSSAEWCARTLAKTQQLRIIFFIVVARQPTLDVKLKKMVKSPLIFLCRLKWFIRLREKKNGVPSWYIYSSISY